MLPRFIAFPHFLPQLFFPIRLPQVDPKSDSVWATWVAMEEGLGFLERADDLRIRQAEQQWEFEVRGWGGVGGGRVGV